MSKKILVTGGTGCVGRNSMSLLRSHFDVLAPRRAELDVTSADAVESYVKKHHPDVIVHLANPNPAKNVLDESVDMFRGSIDSFMGCYRSRELVEKVVYLGSGAELDKRYDMCLVHEEDFGRSYPTDAYGASKYVENTIARTADNVINLRLFACYGPGDHWSKFITHCIRSIMAGADITIRQDCYFDYLHVSDLAKVIVWAVESDTKYKDYNICTGVRYLLSEIAEMVREQMHSDAKIELLTDGMNCEYTASPDRLRREYFDEFLNLEEGVKRQIDYERSVYPEGGYDRL